MQSLEWEPAKVRRVNVAMGGHDGFDGPIGRFFIRYQIMRSLVPLQPPGAVHPPPGTNHRPIVHPLECQGESSDPPERALCEQNRSRPQDRPRRPARMRAHKSIRSTGAIRVVTELLEPDAQSRRHVATSSGWRDCPGNRMASFSGSRDPSEDTGCDPVDPHTWMELVIRLGMVTQPPIIEGR